MATKQRVERELAATLEAYQEVVLPADELSVLRERFVALEPGQKLTLKGEVIDAT